MISSRFIVNIHIVVYDLRMTTGLLIIFNRDRALTEAKVKRISTEL